jgi:DNA-binding beta-propeller fold protein YncE
MRNVTVFCLAIFFVIMACTPKQHSMPGSTNDKINRVLLPNGWSLTPTGKQLTLGDLPMNMVLTKDNKRAVITHNGQSTQSLILVDLENEKILHEMIIPKSWYGLAITSDGRTVYASGGNDNIIRAYSILNDRLQKKDSIAMGSLWPKSKISPTGMSLDEKSQQLFVVTKEDSALYVIDLAQRSSKKLHKLPCAAYTCLLSSDAKKLYISLWGNKSVGVWDVAGGKMEKNIATSVHPNEMIFSPDQKLMYVACADDNAVSIIDLQQEKVIETVLTALYPDAPTGSTTNALALTPDGRTLAVANADNNCLAMFDVSETGKSKSLGFVPTGWYPTSVRIANGKVYVCNGKGLTSKANPKGPNPYSRKPDAEYIGGLFKGTLSIFNIPTKEELMNYSRLVYTNTPYSKDKELHAQGEAGNPIPRNVGDASPIKYVFYIIKENRTYDQVFGDIAEGNGDRSLCIFPDSVTPNQHALAKQFVLLDNFYVDAEVSADGHNWSMAAYANDYIEKTWPTSYGGRGGTYDYEGSKAIAHPRDGFLWDFCARKNVSFRTYGEFADRDESYLLSLKGKSSARYPSYDLSIKDVYRFGQWKIDFDSLISLGKVPHMNIVRFGNDHTAGVRIGVPSPAAMVADNDQAVGMFVEHLSRSPIWKESVVFVLEDDAQNGPDHIDAHRSPCLVISPWTKQKHVESSMYSTSGVLRTIELILGLPPMSQYDAAATPMFACFAKKPDLAPYKLRAAKIDLSARNVIDDKWSKLSYQFNLDKEDQAPDLLFNEIIWKSVKGRNTVMPAPRRAAFVVAER